VKQISPTASAVVVASSGVHTDDRLHSTSTHSADVMTVAVEQ